MSLQEDLQVGSCPRLDWDSPTRTRPEAAATVASFRGLAGGAAQDRGPSRSPFLGSCPDPDLDLVLGTRPGEAKTWSQREVGTGQPLSLEPWTSQPAVEPLQAHKD